MTGSTIDGNRWSWAAYLGASWTWCIGMFLPVLLVRDYGPWAWVIFAVPNVVGAAAMGWVMRTRETSRDYTARHASACRLFSFVTIAFQLFFAMWWLPRLVGPVGYVGPLVLVQAAFTPMVRSTWLRIGGAIAILTSVVMAFGLHAQHALGWPDDSRSLAAGDALGLTMVCLAGFVTCPYLDLTFHRARLSTSDADAKAAFGVGFGVLFASMIVLTFFYARSVARPDAGVNASMLMGRAGQAYLAIHWIVQMAYTVNLHAAELVKQGDNRDDRGVMRGGLGLWLAVALATGLAAAFSLEHGVRYHDRPIGELAYRLFMSGYGLLFPAYVLLAYGRRRVPTAAWLIVSALATPFYWLAFVEGRMAWATGGVGVLIVGSLIARTIKRPAPVLPTG